MKVLAIFLIVISVILSSLSALQSVEKVAWIYFIPSLGMGVLGLIIIKLRFKKDKKEAVLNTSNFNNIKVSLTNIINNLDTLKINENNLNSLNSDLDRLFLEDISKFIEARYLIKYKYGVLSFSNIMSHFAAAERLLNRAWSASVDGYINEVIGSIEASKSEFKLCLESLNLLILNK